MNRILPSAALALLLLLGAACEPAAPAPPKPPVLAVGDSVTAQSAAEIRSAIPGAIVSAFPGLRAEQLLPALEAQANARSSGTLLLLVGYNDLAQRSGAPQLEAVAAQAARFACPVWLLLPTKAETAFLDEPIYTPEEARLLNYRIWKLAQAHGIRIEPRWRDAVDASPRHTLTGFDGLHPSEAGRAVLAAVEARAAQACP